MVESVHNALIILGAIRDQGVLRLKEAADEIGAAESTAHRLLRTLAYHNFVVQDEDRRYRPGPALSAELAAPPWGRALRDAALPVMKELSAATGETVNIVVRTGTRARVISSVESAQLVRAGSRQGHLPLARASAGGRALLAELPDRAVAALYSSPDSDDRLHDHALKVLLRTLHTTRSVGYATTVDAVENGLSAVACALRNDDGSALAALVVALPTARLSTCTRRGLISEMHTARRHVELHIAELPRPRAEPPPDSREQVGP